MYDTRGGLNSLVADCEKDTITVSGLDCFLNLMRSTSETDYNAHTKMLTG